METAVQQSEKSILLADRRTSSLDEEQLLSTLHEYSKALPSRSNVALEKASDGLLKNLQGTQLANRLKGLGLAGISTLFQAAMSVCAKDLGMQTSCDNAQSVQPFIVRCRGTDK